MRKTLLYIFSFLTLSLSAQDIKLDILGSSGGRISSINHSFSYTLGEPIVGTINNTNNFFRQGFQQPSFRMGVPGCIDSLACNYDSSATIDDSSCVYSTSSITTITACDSYTWNDSTYTQNGTYSYSGASTSSNNYFIETYFHCQSQGQTPRVHGVFKNFFLLCPN